MDYFYLTRNGHKGGIVSTISEFFTDTTSTSLHNQFDNAVKDLKDIKNKLTQSIGNDFQPVDILIKKHFSEKYVQIIVDCIAIIISCTSAYLAWTCNKKHDLGRRIAVTVLAFLFGMFYLIYSIVFISSQCSDAPISTAISV